MKDALEGGCMCGAVRYRVTGGIDNAGYCHCRMCQRSAGAPVLAWGTVPAASFSWSHGTPLVYASSEKGRRSFCSTCGTQLLFADPNAADEVDVNLVTLDDPSAVRPDHHIWAESRLPWFDTKDHLPRFARSSKEG